MNGDFTIYFNNFSCVLHFSEPKEDDISEEDLRNLYSQPQKRKKIEASPEPLEEYQVESSSKEHPAELHDKDCHDTDSVLPSLKDVEEYDDNDMNSATPPEASRPKNPFAKRHTSPKKVALPNSNFNVIKKFSKMRKTDSSIVVQSRWVFLCFPFSFFFFFFFFFLKMSARN